MLGKGTVNTDVMKGNTAETTSDPSDPALLFRQDYTVVDSVLSAPRSSYPDIVKLTEKNVQSGNFHDLKVVPGYYTVATDRGALSVRQSEATHSVARAMNLLSSCRGCWSRGVPRRRGVRRRPRAALRQR